MTSAAPSRIASFAVALRAGCALSILAGLFWLGESYRSHFAHEGTDVAGAGFDAVIPPVPVFIFVVVPCLACIVGGWLTMRGVRGWRWPPVFVCTFYALLLSNTHGIGWLFVAWNAATAVLLLTPQHRPSASQVERGHAGLSRGGLPAWDVLPVALIGLGMIVAAVR